MSITFPPQFGMSVSKPKLKQPSVQKKHKRRIAKRKELFQPAPSKRVLDAYKKATLQGQEKENFKARLRPLSLELRYLYQGVHGKRGLKKLKETLSAWQQLVGARPFQIQKFKETRQFKVQELQTFRTTEKQLEEALQTILNKHSQLPRLTRNQRRIKESEIQAEANEVLEALKDLRSKQQFQIKGDHSFKIERLGLRKKLRQLQRLQLKRQLTPVEFNAKRATEEQLRNLLDPLIARKYFSKRPFSTDFVGAFKQAVNTARFLHLLSTDSPLRQEELNLLVSKDANLNAISKGKPALHWTLLSTHPNENEIKWLLANGADPNAIDTDGVPAINLALASGRHSNLLIQNGAQAVFPPTDNRPLISWTNEETRTKDAQETIRKPIPDWSPDSEYNEALKAFESALKVPGAVSKEILGSAAVKALKNNQFTYLTTLCKRVPGFSAQNSNALQSATLAELQRDYSSTLRRPSKPSDDSSSTCCDDSECSTHNKPYPRERTKALDVADFVKANKFSIPYSELHDFTYFAAIKGHHRFIDRLLINQPNLSKINLGLFINEAQAARHDFRRKPEVVAHYDKTIEVLQKKVQLALAMAIQADDAKYVRFQLENYPQIKPDFKALKRLAQPNPEIMATLDKAESKSAPEKANPFTLEPMDTSPAG